MFSTIGNIISGLQKPREAETSDTRQEIKRHDPDQERRKDEDSGEDELNSFLSEDQATVSIESLYIFLENFLRGQIEKAQLAEKSEEFSVPADVVPSTKPASPSVQNRNAQAAHAYAHAAEVMETRSVMKEAAPARGAMDIESEEVRMIHSLLADLSELSANNVQFLHIERDETFLLSLRHAVDKARKNR